VLAGRITRSAAAPVVTAAAILGSGGTWQRGVADIRNDPPTLFLFWLGALLLLWRREANPRGAWRAGTGIGLIVVAALWNPKWPLPSLLFGLIYLVTLRDLWRSPERKRLLVRAVGAPVALVAVALGVILATTTLGDYVFFTFRYNAAFFKWFKNASLPTGWFAIPERHCPVTFRGRWPALGLGVVAAALIVGPIRRAWSSVDVPRAIIALAMAVLAGIEVRFLYCYPRLWPQHYLMWGFTLAVVYGCVPGAVMAVAAALRRGLGARTVVALECASAAVALGLFVHSVRPRLQWSPRSDIAYWNGISQLQKELGPRDRVWLQPHLHPIGALDSSYYWFSFDDVVPFSLSDAVGPEASRRLPPMEEKDLPLCKLMRGEDVNVRLVPTEVAFDQLPLQRECLRRLLAEGRLMWAGVQDVLEVKEERDP